MDNNEINSWAEEMMEKHGWYMHAVPAEDGIHANYHTHGLDETYNHPDLQVTLPLNHEVAHKIICTAVDMIEDGVVFKDGMMYNDIIITFPVEFRKFREMDREVLRIIFPDSNGYFPDDDECDEMYKAQYDPN